eukprot:1276134-Amphidinium_carterae.2
MQIQKNNDRDNYFTKAILSVTIKAHHASSNQTYFMRPRLLTAESLHAFGKSVSIALRHVLLSAS